MPGTGEGPGQGTLWSSILVSPLWRVILGSLGVALTAASTLVAGGGATASPAPLPFTGHGSIGEAYVTGAPPGVHLAVLNARGVKVGSGVVDRLGSLIVRNLTPGPDYRFTDGAGPGARRTPAFSVLSTTSTPPASFYSGQHLQAGLNYVRMRDGILLAATVRLPPGKTLADGPFPTVIEYSGYDVAGPHSLIDALEGHASLSDPLLPSTSTVVGSVIAPLLGFATVSVQMRGTGCSGGAFDLFGLPSDYDGYDVVQTVGAQPWVLNHKVGMVGISYSGFSQLVVAGTDPPDLAAITPLSPTDDLYSTGYPGGIYNDGFAAGWTAQRVSDAAPAPQGGQPGRRQRSPRVTRRAWPTNVSTCRPKVSSHSSAPTSAGRRRCSTNARLRCGPRMSPCPCSWSAPCRTRRWARSGPRSSTPCATTRTST